MVRGKLALWQSADQVDPAGFERLYLEKVEQAGQRNAEPDIPSSHEGETG